MNTNVIVFPSCLQIDNWWWYGGKRWKHVGKIKEAVSAREWDRLYQWDLRRFLRGEICNSHNRQGGGSAA